MNELSKCCNAPIKAHYAYEGTGCYVCEKCGKACDPAIPHTKGTRSYEEILKLIADNEKEAQKPRIEKLALEEIPIMHGYLDTGLRQLAPPSRVEIFDKINEIITEIQRLSDEVTELREEGGE